MNASAGKSGKTIASNIREEYVAAKSTHARQLDQSRQAAKASLAARRQQSQRKQAAREARAGDAVAEGGAAAAAFQPAASAALLPGGTPSQGIVMQGSMTAYGDEEGDISGSEASELSYESEDIEL